jgi:two-component system cell cycle response regulator CtrA
MFLNHLYGGMDEPAVKIIDVFICKLRKKLANASMGKNYIETIWGGGHVLREPTDTEPIGRQCRQPLVAAFGPAVIN